MDVTKLDHAAKLSQKYDEIKLVSIILNSDYLRVGLTVETNNISRRIGGAIDNEKSEGLFLPYGQAAKFTEEVKALALKWLNISKELITIEVESL